MYLVNKPFLMKYFDKLLHFIFLLIVLLDFVKSDLPVHCLSSQIEGDWLIRMGENRFDRDLKCGHKRPDQNLDHYDINVEQVFKQKYEIIIKVERPDKVLSVKDNKQIGKWTMIYDEGFEFSIHDQIYFAFSRYKKIGKFKPTNTDTIDTVGYKNICDKTFIGWFHNKINNSNWGCYYAEKINMKKTKYNINLIDYNKIFTLSNIPFITNDEESEIDSKLEKPKKNNNALNRLKNNYLKQNNKKIDNNNHDNKSGNSEDLFTEKNCDLNQRERINTNTANSSENSYIDFVKTLGWAGSSNREVEIPHLDIYFMNDDNQNNDSGFLEINTNLKYFQPDLDYVNKINDPKNT